MTGPGGPLAGTEWIVVELPGGGVARDAPPTLAFAEDGRVHGFGGVNRLAGGYAVEGDLVTIGPLAMTRMAGPAEQMDQEHRFAAALEGPLSFALAGDALTLGEVRLVRATVPSA